MSGDSTGRLPGGWGGYLEGIESSLEGMRRLSEGCVEAISRVWGGFLADVLRVWVGSLEVEGCCLLAVRKLSGGCG